MRTLYSYKHNLLDHDLSDYPGVLMKVVLLSDAQAELARVRGLVKKHAIHCQGNLMACYECGSHWRVNEPEHHAEGCAAKETT